MITQHNVETGGSPPGAITRGLLGGLMLGDSPLARSPSRSTLSFPTPKLACIYCTKDTFTTMEALQLHVQAMHGKNLLHIPLFKLACIYCTKDTFITMEALQLHVEAMHGKNLLHIPLYKLPCIYCRHFHHHGSPAAACSGQAR